jgi:hypothetical protein
MRRMLRQRQEKPLTPKEIRAAARAVADLAARREHGEIPLDQRNWRERDGRYLGVLALLRSFAVANGLPRPAIEHGISCPSDEQLIRDLFERYGLTTTMPGVRLSDWAPGDQQQMLALWRKVKVAPPQFAPVQAAPSRTGAVDSPQEPTASRAN